MRESTSPTAAHAGKGRRGPGNKRDEKGPPRPEQRPSAYARRALSLLLGVLFESRQHSSGTTSNRNYSLKKSRLASFEDCQRHSRAPKLTAPCSRSSQN